MLTSRNIRAIQQRARETSSSARVDEVLETLRAILPLLGEQSHSRQMINRIGYALLGDTITVVAPSCPDYSHDAGVYTFSSVGGGVPLLARLHIALLDKIVPHMPRAVCEIVLADHEADEPVLCAKVGKTRAAFLDSVHASASAVRELVAGRGWKVSNMTDRFPNLIRFEKEFEASITADLSLSMRITSDTISRRGMYEMLGVREVEDMRRRTVRVAAQYCAMGHLSCRDGFMICNHQTVNLSWYNDQGATVLHNAVSVY